MDGVSNIRLILEDALDLGDRPCILFGLRRIFVDIRKIPVPLVIQPAGSGHLFLCQYPCDFRHTGPVIGSLIDFFHDPPCFLIGDDPVLGRRVFFVSEDGICADTLLVFEFGA